MTFIASYDQLLDKSDLATSSIYAKFISCLASSSRIMVILGAGVSVAAGIPDFRSSDGLYAKIEAEYPGLLKKGQHLFDASILYAASGSAASSLSMRAAYFSFLSMMKEMSDGCEPTRTHYFIKWLQDQGKLWRVYTQNIDGLEIKVGLVEPRAQAADKAAKPPAPVLALPLSKPSRETQKKAATPSTLFLHGSLATLSCTLCPHDEPFASELVALYRSGKTKDCPCCAKRTQERIRLGKRGFPIGLMTPSILLYNDHPGVQRSQPSFSCGYQMVTHTEAISQTMSADTQILRTALASLSSKAASAAPPEMVLVMGTSCKVVGIKKWIKTIATYLHQLNGHERTADPMQTKLTALLREIGAKPSLRSSVKASTGEQKASGRKLLEVCPRRWVVYINREPLEQKEWANVFDLQLVGDCDTLTAKIKNDMIAEFLESKENRPVSCRTGALAKKKTDRPGISDKASQKGPEETLTPSRVTSYFHVKKSISKPTTKTPSRSICVGLSSSASSLSPSPLFSVLPTVESCL